MATQPSSPFREQRTPFRNVQPEALENARDESEVAIASKKAKDEVFHSAEFDAEDVENMTKGDFPSPHKGMMDAAADATILENHASLAHQDEPQIYHAESPKRPGGGLPSIVRTSSTCRRRSRPVRSSIRRSLRASMFVDGTNPNLRASISSVGVGGGGGEIFNREVFDVHSEIDKLLGGLKTELDNWRTEFDLLQDYWFSRVMCVPHSINNEDVHLRSLYEFQCLLERHLEETEFDIQDLEERLKISEVDRFELQKLLEEGSLEVEDLETKNASNQREFGKKTNSLQTRIMQAERELVQCKKDMGTRNQELDELRKQVVDGSEKIHEMESAANKSKIELSSANAKVTLYEDKIQQARGDLSVVTEEKNEIQLQCKMLQSSLDSKSDECKRLSAELHCKGEEIRLLSDNLVQYEQRVSELQNEATDSFQSCLAKKEALQKDQKKIASLEDNQKRLHAEVSSLHEKLREREEEVALLEQQLETLSFAKEGLEEEVQSLGKRVEDESTDNIKHSKELKKIASYLDQAKRELKQATDSEVSLSQENESLQIKCENQGMELEAFLEEKKQLKDLIEEKNAKIAEYKLSCEGKTRLYQQENEKVRVEMEEKLDRYYKEKIDELESHHKTLNEEKQKSFEAELARSEELLNERKQRSVEERNAIESSMHKKYEVKIQQIKNEMSEKLSSREKDLITESNQELAAMQLAHEKAVEAAAAEAAAAAAAERARRFDFEEAQRGRTEKAIREALRTADDATSELRKKFAEEREGLSNEILLQEQSFKKSLAESQDTIFSLQEEVNRLQASKSVAETEIVSRQKQLASLQEENQKHAATITSLKEQVEELKEESEAQQASIEETITRRERAMKAELNSRLESVSRAMQEMQSGF
jgi:chromosome segregation ATPase